MTHITTARDYGPASPLEDFAEIVGLNSVANYNTNDYILAYLNLIATNSMVDGISREAFASYF